MIIKVFNMFAFIIIHLVKMLIKSLLSTYYVPGTVLGAKDMVVNMPGKISALKGLPFSWGPRNEKYKQQTGSEKPSKQEAKSWQCKEDAKYQFWNSLVQFQRERAFQGKAAAYTRNRQSLAQFPKSKEVGGAGSEGQGGE